MYLRMRQICLVTHDIDKVTDQLFNVFGLEVCHRDPAIEQRGLQNALLPIGSTFLEVVAPIRDGTAAARYLERRGGDGGYMFIADCDDVARRRGRMRELGIRVVSESRKTGWASYEEFQLHPRDTGGTLISISTHAAGEDTSGDWHWAGPNRTKCAQGRLVKSVVGVEIQSADPEPLAARWSQIFEVPVTNAPKEGLSLVLDVGFVRFVHDRDGRGEGLAAVHLEVLDRGRIMASARSEGLRLADDSVDICGTRFYLY